MIAWNPRDPFMKFFPGGAYDTAFAQKASPASYIHPGLPPCLIVHGGKDTTVPIGQAAAFAEKAKEAGADVTYEVLHAGHGLTGEDLALASEWLASRRSIMASETA